MLRNLGIHIKDELVDDLLKEASKTGEIMLIFVFLLFHFVIVLYLKYGTMSVLFIFFLLFVFVFVIEVNIVDFGTVFFK